MSLRFSMFAIALAAFSPLHAGATENWGQLKLGMSADETIAALGQPLIRTRGRGFETWTYDKGGDVLIYGSLIGWTAPLSAQLTVRSKDIWNENRAVPYLNFVSLLPRRSPASPRRITGGETNRPGGFYSDFYRQ